MIDPPAPDIRGAFRDALDRLPGELARTGDTLESFAARIGVTARTLRYWREGKRTPSGSALILFADEFSRIARKESSA